MDVERSSLCNCVVNFLLEENYILTAFELLHELLEDGRDVHAIRLKHFFADHSHFPPHLITRFNSLKVADPQTLLEEKEALEEKLALCEYELRLAKEDVLKLGADLQKKGAFTPDHVSGVASYDRHKLHQEKRETPFSDLGPLKENERRDLNFAVKEYLLLAGYRLSAMTFYEEVTDQNLDVWENSCASVPDALRHYYYQYLSSTTEAAEEKIAMLRENESLVKENEMLKIDNTSLLKNKELAESQILALTRSLEAVRKDLKDKEILVQKMKQSLEHQVKEINGCRAEITSLKMLIEGSRSTQNSQTVETENVQSESLDSYREEIKSLQKELQTLKASQFVAIEPVESGEENESVQKNDEVIDLPVNSSVQSPADMPFGVLEAVSNAASADQTFDENNGMSTTVSVDKLVNSDNYNNGATESAENVIKHNGEAQSVCSSIVLNSECLDGESVSGKMGLEAIQILSDALPKIVPYVLINHREELLPLIMCAIERNPDSSTRDSLTHTLFNLIKRPDEQQRRIIMDACVSLAKNVGEMRTETELLPQCWEQINHMYEERRLLVAQSCGQLAEFVRPEIRDSLILSIVQQLIEDSATVVREAAAHNLALLLPLFPSMEKYFKVEDLMFQLVCDPSGIVVDTTIKELVHALISWGDKLDHVLRVLLAHILSSAQRCPPLSGVEGSVESHLHVLGERERWNVEVLLRLLAELLPFVHRKVIDTCPFLSISDDSNRIISTSLLEDYARGQEEWPAFEWLHIDCFPDLIRLASLLPQKEDNLRNRITDFLLAVSEQFGDHYLTHIMLPVFLVAVGDKADLSYLPSSVQARMKGLKPKNAVAQRLAILCVLPILLAGVLGYSSKHEQLAEYLGNILVRGAGQDGQPASHHVEIFNSVRFLCTFEEHHNMLFNILWEMVVSHDVTLKIRAANLLKVIVPCVEAKVASIHVVPALVTLGTDQNLQVKYASIEAFGAVAQHFKNDMIVDKIRVQMDAFLEDGSHEATIAVVRALVVAVPHTTERLRDYLLSNIFQFTSVPTSSTDVNRRRERADAFCESIRALDATDLSASSVKDLLLPAIQNLLRDTDALDPAHKEALEIIVKERAGGTFEAISKVMGSHLGITSSVSSFANVSSFFGEGRILGKKETGDLPPTPEAVDSSNPVLPSPAEDTRFRRIMRGGFSDMLRGKSKSNEDFPPTNQ